MERINNEIKVLQIKEMRKHFYFLMAYVFVICLFIVAYSYAYKRPGISSRENEQKNHIIMDTYLRMDGQYLINDSKETPTIRVDYNIEYPYQEQDQHESLIMFIE